MKMYVNVRNDVFQMLVVEEFVNRKQEQLI